MDPEDFRAHAHRLVDWMADYLRDVATLPVVPPTKPGDVRRKLPTEAPERGEPFEAIWADFLKVVMPGMTHWNHPSFFAYFPANNSPPSILAEMATATLGAQCMAWQTSPAATELEEVVLDWLRGLVGLPQGFRGVIQDTASTATLVALLSARERASAHAFGQHGETGGAPLVVYTSTQGHSSIDKAVKLAGYGLSNLRHVAVDERFAMRPEALEAAIRRDLTEGRKPACVVATIGTTSSTAVDPIPAIADVCDRYGVWLHIDAAYAGSAALLPEKREHFVGIERADSFAFNPHKWLLTNFDCCAHFVRDPEHLVKTFLAHPEYLKTKHDAEVSNFKDWGIPLGRRFRALKLWFVLRSYGAEGLRAVLRRHIDLAARFADAVRAEPGFEVVAPAPFGLVCFRLRPEGQSGPALDALNQRLLEKANEGGAMFLTHTRLGDAYVLRMSIGQRTTEASHVDAAWARIRSAAASLVPVETRSES